MSELLTSNRAEKEPSFEVHRLKGRLPVSNGTVKLVQGVREVFEIKDASETINRDGSVSGPLEGKLVLIGRHIAGVDFRNSYFNSMNGT